ncbi:GntR family transcriptional regulator [Alkalihalobacillus sp. R86527]|uniref:GntR family transcriptional regulator n=1 Tax=Alkalihalobacillus sp. R86527 TaxID=3093863 RepID=UPI003670D5CD
MKTKQSAEQMIIDKLKQAILSRELAPGTKLVEAIISEKLQVSRTPIRNAFRKLVEEGYVTLVQNKGAYVVQPDIKEIIQAFELRIELECIAVKFGLDKITNQDILKLEDTLEEELAVYKTQDIPEYIALNKRFHMLLADRSGNKYISEFLHKVIEQIDIYLRIYDVVDTKSEEKNKSLDEHRKIIDAIRGEDIEKVQTAIRHHLQSTLETLKSTAEGYKSLDQML